jgi:hypothetical protein
LVRTTSGRARERHLQYRRDLSNAADVGTSVQLGRSATAGGGERMWWVAMAFSIKLAPGFRVSASSRGVRTSMGPRAARFTSDAALRDSQPALVQLAAVPEDERPGTVIVIIQTDGHENTSQDWTRERVFDLITEQRTRYNWTFLFLGADQDAIEASARLGVDAGDSLTWDKSAAAVRGAGAVLSAKVGRERRGDRSGFSHAERKRAGG